MVEGVGHLSHAGIIEGVALKHHEGVHIVHCWLEMHLLIGDGGVWGSSR